MPSKPKSAQLLHELAKVLTEEQQWYDEARSLWQGTIGKPEADRAGELVKAGAAARHQRAKQLQAIATEGPRQVAAELQKLAIVLDTTADSVADRLCELAELATEPPKAEAANAHDDIGPEERALALLVKHPDWTQAAMAKAAGVNRTTLYRFRRYQAAREALQAGKADIPHGSKDKNGNIEAWDSDTFCDTDD